MNPKLYIALVIFTGLFWACESDKPEAVDRELPASFGKRVWVINEGNFQFGNAALGVYEKEDEAYYSKIFEQTNSIGLGDVFQSINMVNGEAYLVVNNSGKIEIVDTTRFERSRTITGLNSPRYVQQINDQKAYISDLYANGIHILNIPNSTITGKIKASEWTERMILKDDQLFVSMPKSEHIYVIDVTTDTVMDSIAMAYGSNAMVMDKSGFIWVLCQGSISKNKGAGLYRINPSTLTISSQFPLDENLSPANMAINPDGDKLYFVYDDLYEMPIESNMLPSSTLFPANNRIFYGLGVDHNNGDIYLADAKGYVQKGQVYRLDVNGNLIHSFQTDIIPSGFYFE